MTVAVENRNVLDEAHRDAVSRPSSEVASDLQELLGQKLVAFAIGDRHPKTVGRYARGEREPEEDAHAALVDLYTVVGILRSGGARPGPWIKKWMLGSNPRLRGKAPVQVFHDGQRYRVMGAAQAFISRR
jgi:hypothetical protein